MLTCLVQVEEELTPNQGSIGSNETFRDEAIALYEERPARGPFTLAMGNSAIYVSLPNVTSDHESIVSAILAQVEDGSALDYLPSDVPKAVADGYLAQLSLLAESHANPRQPILEAPWLSTTPGNGFLLKPLSRGSVRINGSDPDAEPVIDYRTAENPIDLDVMASFTPFFRRYYETETLQALGPSERAPGANVTEAADIIEYMRDVITPSFMHPCCTASMMPENKGGVVGPDLKVHGLGKVRVADISIMPLIPGTHTSATAYAIGEKVSSHWGHWGMRVLTRSRLRTLSSAPTPRTRRSQSARRRGPSSRCKWEAVGDIILVYNIDAFLEKLLNTTEIFRLDNSLLR